MDVIQLANELNRNQNVESASTVSSRFHCTARFRKCLNTTFYALALLMLLMHLLRSMHQEGDLLSLLQKINVFLHNTSTSVDVDLKSHHS
jgi:hypothetical protein